MTTPVSGSGRARPRVLCIDGDEASRRVLGRLLERLGCVAVLAESGARARELCEHRPRFLLSILDPQLPDEDGLRLLRDLRAHLGDRAAPTVLFTATVPKACPEGAMTMLRKPDDLARLAHAVNAALVAESRRAQLARTERVEREVTETYAAVVRPTGAPPPPDAEVSGPLGGIGPPPLGAMGVARSSGTRSRASTLLDTRARAVAPGSPSARGRR